MFRKILIANRGEIACRVIATAHRLGIATVAVYSDADRDSRHVALAGEAWYVGPSPARESYLDAARIIEVARASGAEAIHPGYGFLSENADFAQACADAGIVFIGPPPGAIRAMGSKAESKALMERSGVPLVPGYHGADQDDVILGAEAAKIGYPVLIKASAGGGGKGMRIVASAGDFLTQLHGARREARASFGDERMLVEKYLTDPRHIEIQVFADTHGNCVHLFERDCSIQRRHQKVLEEAPAPGMTAERRRAMGDAAIAAARAVGYVGAGTVEFIAEGDHFFFMEMNTRLQVEHPVTEQITGQDLVEWQLRVAAGGTLPCTQEQLFIAGHAIEARIYAEDPERDFMPSTGTLAHLVQPRDSEQVRVDTGVRQGTTITPFYDPMIAKLIVWGDDRDEALARLRSALDEYEVVGVRTNLGLLRAIAAEPDFAAAKLTTGFIAAHPGVLERHDEAGSEITALAAAAIELVLEAQSQARAQAARGNDPHSPWAESDAWRLNIVGYYDVHLSTGHLNTGEATEIVRVLPGTSGAWKLVLRGRTLAVTAERLDGALLLTLDGTRRRIPVIRTGESLTAIIAGRNHTFTRIDPFAPPQQASSGAGGLFAPIPGRVVKVLAEPGQKVLRGEILIVLEAMKMEMTLTAQQDGTVDQVRCAEGDLVAEGAELVMLVPA